MGYLFRELSQLMTRPFFGEFRKLYKNRFGLYFLKI